MKIRKKTGTKRDKQKGSAESNTSAPAADPEALPPSAPAPTFNQDF